MCLKYRTICTRQGLCQQEGTPSKRIQKQEWELSKAGSPWRPGCLRPSLQRSCMDRGTSGYMVFTGVWREMKEWAGWAGTAGERQDPRAVGPNWSGDSFCTLTTKHSLSRWQTTGSEDIHRKYFTFVFRNVVWDLLDFYVLYYVYVCAYEATKVCQIPWIWVSNAFIN